MDYPGKVITKNQVTPTQTSATGVWTLDDAAAAVKNNNWPVAGVPNPISKSLRFNSADSAYLNRTPGVAGNRRTWTWSGWVKRSGLGSTQYLFGATTDSFSLNWTLLYLPSDNTLLFQDYATSERFQLRTTQVFRDVSAWYHLVVAVDTTQATSTNRIKIYVNGSQITAFSTASYPSQNLDTFVDNNVSHQMGGISNYFNGYMTEINFIDGQALTPSSFGMTDPQTGAWEPIKYTGTYGTNGFYLNFKDATSTTTLGYDYSGNANNWTTNNFSVTAGSGNDSLTDVPTPWIAYNTTGDVGGVVRGNYCTLNPLAIATTSRTYSNGNLDVSIATTNANVFGSIAIPTSGKWYWEYQTTTIGGGSAPMGGVAAGFITDTSSAVFYRTNGDKIVNGTQSAYGATYTTTDTIGVAADVDGGTVTFYKNGSSQGALTFAAGGLFPALRSNAATDNFTFNFGQRPFAYTPPAGFLSLCTTNLPNPTIGTSTTTQAGKYMNVVLYTGNGSTQSITGVGFQPDLVWLKARSAAYGHGLFDVLRGTTKRLSSDSTGAEGTESGVTSFDSDGFTMGSATFGNNNGTTMVGWNWKANGAGSTNTAGSITSTVSANTTAGFSIVTYTGNGGSNSSIGHGLGVAPSMIITKGRSGAAVNNWLTWHGTFGVSSYIALNLTSAVNYAGATTTVYGGSSVTAPNSTTYTIGVDLNTNTATYVAYCFAAVAGYSAFGSYTGNASTDGPFVYLGFRPRYLLVKRTDTISSWMVVDSARDTYNMVTKGLYPNLSDAEGTGDDFDFLSNGFKLRDTGAGNNASGGTYIYAAFAEFPFKFANAR